MARFALLRHDSPRGLHWDFLLETGQQLRAWALPNLPQRGAELICEALSDHRLAYLDYEGEISGGRGSVTRWDQGSFDLQCGGDPQWLIELHGEKLTGSVSLQPLADQPERWRFLWVENVEPST